MMKVVCKSRDLNRDWSPYFSALLWDECDTNVGRSRYWRGPGLCGFFADGPPTCISSTSPTCRSFAGPPESVSTSLRPPVPHKAKGHPHPPVDVNWKRPVAKTGSGQTKQNLPRQAWDKQKTKLRAPGVVVALDPAHNIRGVEIVHHILRENVRPFFECCFPYVCPEPVLVNNAFYI